MAIPSTKPSTTRLNWPKNGMTYIPPFDDPDVIAGQGTIGMEILRQHPDDLDAVFVAIGGGGFRQLPRPRS